MAAAQVVATSSNPYLMLTSGASGRINALFSRRFLRCLIAIINAVIVIFLVPFRCWKRTVVITLTEKSKEEKQQDHHRKSNSSGSASAGSVLRFPATVLPWRSGTGGGVVGRLQQEVAARRALAIRRVLQDDDEGSVREFCPFVSSRGDTIFTQSWTPVSLDVSLWTVPRGFRYPSEASHIIPRICSLGPLLGIIVLMHGLNEHSGRYNDFAKQLNANGFKVYAMDWIGHGGSDGLHAFVHSLDDAVNDMKSYLEKVLADNPGLPCFCFGHSTGAAIVLKAVLDPKIEARIAGVVLTSPAVGVQPSHPIFVLLAPLVSLLLPRYQISAANKKGMPVSRDPEALVAKYSDPLVYTGGIRVRTGYEILRISTYLRQNQKRLRVPFLVLHGTADTVTDPGASEKLYMEASSTDKTIKLYEGFLHDLLFEPERDAIKEEIIEWLNSRLWR